MAIAHFAKNYRFSAVYSYDIDFRKKMVAKRQLAPAHRMTFWGTQHLELKNQHLHDQFIQQATCYNYKETGNKASNCPKKTRRSFNGKQFRFSLSPNPPFPYQAPASQAAGRATEIKQQRRTVASHQHQRRHVQLPQPRVSMLPTEPLPLSTRLQQMRPGRARRHQLRPQHVDCFSPAVQPGQRLTHALAPLLSGC